MSALAPARVGWCPGALAPMASGDGLIVRVKPRGGRLSSPQAQAIARASRLYGNGALDLTTRANVQIRGLDEAGLGTATAILDHAGLLDADVASEAARNVVSSPLAGLDTRAVLDIRPTVEALEARLAGDAALHSLPAKFSFLVDDGGGFPLSDVSADIRFEASGVDAGPGFAVRLGGGEDEVAGLCAPERVADAAAALIGVFLRRHVRDPDLRRMSHLVAEVGVVAVLREADLARGPATPRRARTPLRDIVGLVEQGALTPPGDQTAARILLGVAAPFGRLSADALDFLARAAGESGATELRLTPWRSILVPGLDRAAGPALLQSCEAAGFIVDPSDPRLRVAACTGAPGCHRATTAVLDHAAKLATKLGPGGPDAGILLHVSGCSKGCAHAGKGPLVLVADNGAYNIVVDGTASDTPILHGLGFEEAQACVKASARMEPRL